MFIRGAEMKPEPRNADWKGQVHTTGRADLGGRSRRVPSNLVDEAGRRESVFRGEETMTKSVGSDKSRCVGKIGTRRLAVPLQPLSVRKFPFLEVTPLRPKR